MTDCIAWGPRAVRHVLWPAEPPLQQPGAPSHTPCPSVLRLQVESLQELLGIARTECNHANKALEQAKAEGTAMREASVLKQLAGLAGDWACLHHRTPAACRPGRGLPVRAALSG